MKAIKDSAEKIVSQYGLLLDPGAKLTQGFIARAMILASLPHSEPQGIHFQRKNGNYTLSMTADPDFGLPYGSIPRLLLVWMTTEALKTKERKLILGKSLSDFMKQLDIDPTGGRNGSITALRKQMMRLIYTTISCRYSDEGRDAGVRMLLVDKHDLWWSAPKQRDLWPSTVELSESFFKEITTSPVVFYMEALKALRKSPMALDIYMWLTYKNSFTKQPLIIGWESLQAQFGAGYPETAQGKADFKRKFKDAVKKVGVAYSEARKLEFLDAGLQLNPGYPHVPKTKELTRI